ncbi:MAG: CYTH domain-containing protein, partial [Parachlamydiaceae bacterium]|nr:CYTH domain-containing protein [Parachlamydiaceae bacterium]
MDKEIEYKWQAHSLRDYKLFLQLAQNIGANLSKQKKMLNRDQYLDTPEHFFLSSHLECRIRLNKEQSELTLKSFSVSKRVIFVRNENTIQLPSFISKKAALAYCRANFFKNIQPLFEILNNRQVHLITLPCGTCAEASFDQVLMVCGEKKFRMKEIEFEFKSGQLDTFKEFVGQLSPLSLTPSKFSKFEVGMKLLKGEYSPSSI